MDGALRVAVGPSAAIKPWTGLVVVSEAGEGSEACWAQALFVATSSNVKTRILDTGGHPS